MLIRLAAAGVALLLLAAAPAQAKELHYRAELRGDRMPTMTGSKATGEAEITIDTDAHTVAMTMDVKGMKTTDLWSKLAFAPIGPVHLHIYGSHDHSDPSSSALLLPFPFGPGYSETAAGFRLSVKDYAYADGAAKLNSTTSFEDFVAAMQAGRVVLNIHSNTVNDGEISGEVVPVAG